MKYLLILYLCSVNTGQCPTNQYTNIQFNNYFDCINSGYAIAQQTYRSLANLEDFSREKIEREKIVIKFECKGIMVNDEKPEKENDTKKELGVKS